MSEVLLTHPLVGLCATNGSLSLLTFLTQLVSVSQSWHNSKTEEGDHPQCEASVEMIVFLIPKISSQDTIILFILTLRIPSKPFHATLWDCRREPCRLRPLARSTLTLYPLFSPVGTRTTKLPGSDCHSFSSSSCSCGRKVPLDSVNVMNNGNVSVKCKQDVSLCLALWWCLLERCFGWITEVKQQPCPVVSCAAGAAAIR